MELEQLRDAPPDEAELRALLDGWAFDEIDVNAADLRIILARLEKMRGALEAIAKDDERPPHIIQNIARTALSQGEVNQDQTT
jgi:hypothetical protein